MNEPVRVVAVGPRDGLQAEPGEMPTAAKLELIARLAATGAWISEQLQRPYASKAGVAIRNTSQKEELSK